MDGTGAVTLAAKVDSEAGDTWLGLVIAVTDTDATVQTSTVTVSVIVEDIDDNLPTYPAGGTVAYSKNQFPCNRVKDYYIQDMQSSNSAFASEGQTINEGVNARTI